MTEHTPTPWRIRDDFGGWLQGSPLAGETYGDRVANLAKPKGIGKANAAFICKAVNNHEALVNAVETACEYLESEDDFKPAARLREKFLALLASIKQPRS